MVKNKKIIKSYSHNLAQSLINNLNKSTTEAFILHSELIDLDYSRNNLNLKISCNVSIDEHIYKKAYIADSISLYLNNFCLKINEKDIIKNYKIRSKFNYLNKAQIKYIIFPNQLQIKENNGRILYAIEENNVTLLGDKKMYNNQLILESIELMIYNTLRSKIKKILNKMNN